ncbi:hypothetical protein GCM10028895_10850 [Pontibacter rugosus]
MKRITKNIGLEDRATENTASSESEQLNQSNLYAIVDIETTGGQPHQDKITEIAIFIHDGEKIVDKYHTLVNPERPIPYFITQHKG